MTWEDHIRAEHSIMIVPAHLSCFTVTIFSLLLLLVAGLRDAGAQILGQPETGPTTDSDLVSTETNTWQYLFLTPSQEESKESTAPQPQAKTVTPEKDGQEINPCANLAVSGETWLDQVHDYAERNICRPAVWFDHFFGDPSVLEDVRPGMFVKLRSAARWSEGAKTKLLADSHIQWQLPKATRYLKKARIYFDSGSDVVKYTTQPGQPIDPGVDPETGSRKPVIGVRANLYNKFRSLVDINSGIKVSIHPNAYIAMEYQYLKPFGEVYNLRFKQIAMWQAVEHFTDSSQFDLERLITAFTLVRWSNKVIYAEGTNGVTWNTGISFITQLTPKSAISYDTSMWGVNYPGWTVQNYRVGIKYRKNIYRPWLFFEIEPEVTWPRDASQKDYAGQRGNSVFACMATLEIQFGQ